MLDALLERVQNLTVRKNTLLLSNSKYMTHDIETEDSQLVNMFVQTMVFSRSHSFPATHIGTMIETLLLLNQGFRAPRRWDYYYPEEHRLFFQTIGTEHPNRVLDYVRTNMMDSSKDAAMLIALTCRTALQIDASTLSIIIVQLQQHLEEDHDPYKSIARVTNHAPVGDYEKIHAVLDGFPQAQRVLDHWMAVWTIEKIRKDFLEPQKKRQHDDEDFYDEEPFIYTLQDLTTFHARAISTAVGRDYLNSVFVPFSTDGSVTKKVKKWWEMLATLEHSSNIDSSIDSIRMFVDQLLSIVDDRPQSFFLMGHRPDFEVHAKAWIQSKVQAQPLDFGILDFDYLKTLPRKWWISERQIVSEHILNHLEDFIERGGNSLLGLECPQYFELISLETFKTLEESDNDNYQSLFWRMLENPSFLNIDILEAFKENEACFIEKALFKATMLETHGTQYWGIKKEQYSYIPAWLNRLEQWYPEHRPEWEKVKLHFFQDPKKGSNTFLQVHSELLSYDFTIVLMLLDMQQIEHYKTPARNAFAPSRIWQINTPHFSKSLDWIVSALRDAQENKNAPKDLTIQNYDFSSAGVL